MMGFPSLKIGDLVSRVPIIQGGMGVGISLSGLASAVANAGAIGVISAAMPGLADPDIGTDRKRANIRALANEIQKARRMTTGILGVNIMVALTDYADMVKTSLEQKIDIIFAGAGLPLDLPGYLKEGMKTRLVPIVSSGRAAALICRKWLSKFNYLPDAFVVEGPEAGGHLGFKADQLDHPDYSLENLVSDVVDSVKVFEARHNRPIPVIAAGGVYSGADINKFLGLGAAGVQMGTRFVATHECDADPAFKQTYIDAGEEDLVIIKSPVGMPGRALRNAFLDDINNGMRKPFKCPYHCIRTCDNEKSPYCIAIALAGARKGKFNKGFAFAGKNAYRVTEIVSVENLVQSLQIEYDAAVARDGQGNSSPLSVR